jgi:hypothetical protein
MVVSKWTFEFYFIGNFGEFGHFEGSEISRFFFKIILTNRLLTFCFLFRSFRAFAQFLMRWVTGMISFKLFFNWKRLLMFPILFRSLFFIFVKGCVWWIGWISFEIFKILFKETFPSLFFSRDGFPIWIG